MSTEIRSLGAGDEPVFTHIAAGVFDHAVDRGLLAEFLHDPRHHIVVAIEDGIIVAFASGVHYVHPDKPAELFINEVAVAPTHQGQGLGKAVVTGLLEVGRQHHCHEAWVLTDRDNRSAMALYGRTGGEESADPSIMFTYRLG